MISRKELNQKIKKINKKNRKSLAKISRQERVLVVLALFIALSSVFVIRPILEDYLYWRALDPDSLTAQSYSLAEELISANRPIRNWLVPEPDLAAHSVSAVEIHPDDTVRHLLSKNADHPYAIASITKLMTAMVAIDLFDLERKTHISAQAASQIGRTGSIKDGDLLSVKDLIYLTLMESNNGAAYALAEIKGVSEFVRQMNLKASSLGLKNTSFTTPSGLTGANRVDNYSTARELTQMTVYLWQQPEYEEIRRALAAESYDVYDGTGAFYYRVANSNQLLGYYDNLVGGKTGYLPTAGECLLSVFKGSQEGVYLVVTVLGSRNRFLDTKEVVEWLPRGYLYSFNYGF